MDKHNILELVIPTNEPYTMRTYLLPSLKNITELSDMMNICLNFQDPYTQEDVDSIVSEIRSLGFTVYYQLRGKYDIPKRGYVPFNAIRNDACKLNPHSLIYVLADDDFSYQGASALNPSSAVQYLRAVYYMFKYWDRCGCILAGSSLYKYNPRNTIGLTKTWDGDETYITGQSLFLRSLKDKCGYELFPEDALGLYGAKEECILCACRINEGLFPAKYSNSRVRHFENLSKDKNIRKGEEQYGWLQEEIVETNANKYMNDKFGVHIKGVFNHAGVARPEVYYGKGGPDHTTDRNKFFEDFREDTWTIDDYKAKIFAYFDEISKNW